MMINKPFLQALPVYFEKYQNCKPDENVVPNFNFADFVNALVYELEKSQKLNFKQKIAVRFVKKGINELLEEYRSLPDPVEFSFDEFVQDKYL